jgi:hypothetical protein
MVPSFNIEGTRDFFIKILQFNSVVDLENYVIIGKDDLTIHLLKAGKDIGQMEFYLEVDDIDTLWESIKNKLEGIKVREPFDREYGMREIHIGIPHTNALLFIGQDINKNP